MASDIKFPLTAHFLLWSYLFDSYLLKKIEKVLYFFLIGMFGILCIVLLKLSVLYHTETAVVQTVREMHMKVIKRVNVL